MEPYTHMMFWYMRKKLEIVMSVPQLYKKRTPRLKIMSEEMMSEREAALFYILKKANDDIFYEFVRFM